LQFHTNLASAVRSGWNISGLARTLEQAEYASQRPLLINTAAQLLNWGASARTLNSLLDIQNGCTMRVSGVLHSQVAAYLASHEISPGRFVELAKFNHAHLYDERSIAAQTRHYGRQIKQLPAGLPDEIARYAEGIQVDGVEPGSVDDIRQHTMLAFQSLVY